MEFKWTGDDKLKATLYDQMSAVESGRSSLPSLTLDAMLRADNTAPPAVGTHSNRTLLDIMREEHRQGHSRDKTTWKTFRDKLRLKRAAATAPCTSSDIPNPNSDMSVQSTNIRIQDCDNQRSNRLGFLLHNSAESTQETTQSQLTHPQDHAGVRIPAYDPQATSVGTQITHRNAQPAEEETVAREGRIRLSVALAEERALSDREAESAATLATVAPSLDEGQSARMSLMDLLEETDRQMRFVGPRYTLENVSKEDDVEVDKGGATAEFSCCVCMVRSKGAAFIPCGHTFCRVCSRELWVQRGNCPLCNSFIIEILDIF